jgi:hypothetical protein
LFVGCSVARDCVHRGSDYDVVALASTSVSGAMVIGAATAKMEREAAIRLLRTLVAVGLRQRESMANAAIRTVAIQAEVDEFDAARRYAREQGWLIEGGKAFSTTLTSAGWKVAKGE